MTDPRLPRSGQTKAAALQAHFLDEQLVIACKKGAMRGDTKALELAYLRLQLLRDGKISLLCPKCGKPIFISFAEMQKHHKRSTPVVCSCNHSIPISELFDQAVNTATEGLQRLIDQRKPNG